MKIKTESYVSIIVFVVCITQCKYTFNWNNCAFPRRYCSFHFSLQVLYIADLHSLKKYKHTSKFIVYAYPGCKIVQRKNKHFWTYIM